CGVRGSTFLNFVIGEGFLASDLGKLFIGGISWETNEERLKEYFSTYGEVVEAVIMKDRTTGRARGFGFVVFADPIVADMVVKEKHNIDGRMVEAKKAVPRDDQSIISRNSGSMNGSPGPGRTKKIFVGGLASTVTENDFKSYFEQFGTITDVVVMYDHNTQRPRGFGFITYDSEEAVDRVLIKTFHELNGKMVEVKRAVPKEQSPGPMSSPLGGYNYGLSRVNNFLNGNGYSPGYSSNNLGDYRARMGAISSGRSGFPPFSSSYGMGMNFEPGFNASYGGNANFSSNPSYGRGINPYFASNSNRFVNPIGYDGGNSGSSSFFSSTPRNLWGNGGLSYGTNSSNPSNFAASGGSLGGGSSGTNNVNWGISPGQGRGNSDRNAGNLGYSAVENSYGLSGGSYGRNNGNNSIPSTAFGSSNGGYDGALSDLYGGSSSIYGDSTWRSTPERDASSSFGYGLGNAASEVSAKASAGYIGGYTINKRPSNRACNKSTGGETSSFSSSLLITVFSSSSSSSPYYRLEKGPYYIRKCRIELM
ncbi:hypothetical protein V2J09_002606, partial [Rumex salicifolius]